MAKSPRWAALLALMLTLITALATVLPAGSVHADENADANSPVAGQTFRIATDTTFAPFEFRDSTGEMIDIDMDLMRAIAEREGFTVQIQSLGFNAALQALSANQVDAVIAGMSIADARKQVYDFTDSYFQSGVQMAIAKDNTEITSYDDLAGKTVVVKTGSEGETYAKSIQAQYGFGATRSTSHPRCTRQSSQATLWPSSTTTRCSPTASRRTTG